MRVMAAGIGTVTLWASVFPAVRLSVPSLGVLGLTSVRLIVAALALLAVAPFFRVRLPQRQHVPAILATAFLGMFGYQLLLNWAEVSIPAGTASLVASASPLVSAAIAVAFFGERISGIRVAGGAIAIVGITAVCVAQSHLGASAAIVVILGAMVFYGAYHPLVRPLYRHYSGLEVATYGLVASGLMSLPLLLSSWHRVATAGWPALASAAYLGLVPSALAFVLWGYTLARLPVTTATSLLFLVPAIAIVIAFFWLHEVPIPDEVIGGLIVIAGVVLVSRGDVLLGWLEGRRKRVPRAS